MENGNDGRRATVGVKWAWALLLFVGACQVGAETLTNRPATVYCDDAVSNLTWIQKGLTERCPVVGLSAPGSNNDLSELKTSFNQIISYFADTVALQGQVFTNLTVTGLLVRIGAPTNYLTSTPLFGAALGGGSNGWMFLDDIALACTTTLSNVEWYPKEFHSSNELCATDIRLISGAYRDGFYSLTESLATSGISQKYGPFLNSRGMCESSPINGSPTNTWDQAKRVIDWEFDSPIVDPNTYAQLWPTNDPPVPTSFFVAFKPYAAAARPVVQVSGYSVPRYSIDPLYEQGATPTVTGGWVDGDPYTYVGQEPTEVFTATGGGSYTDEVVNIPARLTNTAVLGGRYLGTIYTYYTTNYVQITNSNVYTPSGTWDTVYVDVTNTWWDSDWVDNLYTSYPSSNLIGYVTNYDGSKITYRASKVQVASRPYTGRPNDYNTGMSAIYTGTPHSAQFFVKFDTPLTPAENNATVDGPRVWGEFINWGLDGWSGGYLKPTSTNKTYAHYSGSQNVPSSPGWTSYSTVFTNNTILWGPMIGTTDLEYVVDADWCAEPSLRQAVSDGWECREAKAAIHWAFTYK